MNRWVIVLGLPFLIGVVAPSLIGAAWISYAPESEYAVYVFVGVFITIVTPLMVGMLWFCSRPQKVLKPTA